MKKVLYGVAVTLAAVILCAGTAGATQVDLFYNAVVTGCNDRLHPCVVDMQSPVSGLDNYGYIRVFDTVGFTLGPSTVVEAQFKWLSGVTAWGSPRFDLATTDWSSSVYAYWADNGTGFSGNWETKSLGSISHVDYTLNGVYHYNATMADAIAALAGVTFTKAYVSLDGGGGSQIDQRMLVDRFQVNDFVYTPNCDQPVPEPATLTLLGLGLAGVARAARRRRT